ncbi:MAG: rRNA maturation RNase YbeY [Actinomycetota bacterium]|nr:rRNA maturation RNase YbeY [Actinomycetota bacterium]
MEILVSNQSEVPVNLGLLRDLARYTLLCEGVEPPVELSVALVDQTAIRNLNLKYRGIDEPTDVLSFPLLEETPKTSFPKFLGDVVICPQIAEHQAKKYGQSIVEELCLLLVHGILHLLRYDHEERKKAKLMRDREREILSRFFKRRRIRK